MPRQANGTYQQPANTSAVSNATIGSSANNTLITDIGTELTNSLDRAGRSSMTAALPMGGNKITGMADPVATTDAATKNYVLQSSQQQVASSYANTGSADALTCACTPTVTALTNGMTFFIRCAAANATTTPTFAPDSIAAAVIVKGSGSALTAGDIAGAGFWASLTYDSTLTKWVLNNPATGVIAPPASLGFTKNLLIKTASNTTVTVTADSVITSNGSTAQATALSATINLGTSGAANALDAGVIAVDTWYAIWAIAKADGTTAALASTSATAPTMPSGYTYKSRVGWARTIHSSAILYNVLQSGRIAQYVVGSSGTTTALPNMNNGIGGTYSSTAPTYATTTISNFVPTTASRIGVVAQNGYNGGAIANVLVAPNVNYAGPISANPPPLFLNNGGVSFVMIGTVWMELETTSIAWVSNGLGGALFCLGWEDNI